MWIEDMPRRACIDLLTRVRLGRLACAKAGQPYITPLFFAYHSDSLYSFSTVGQKITWMRDNPLVCVEADEVMSPQKWMSVVAFGRYEELPDAPDYEDERKLAHNLLQQYPIWWEPGFAKTVLHGRERPLELLYFRIHMGQVTGRHARQ